MVHTSTQVVLGSSTCTGPKYSGSLKVREQRASPESQIYSSLASDTPVILLPAPPPTVVHGLLDDKADLGQVISLLVELWVWTATYQSTHKIRDRTSG